MSDTIDKDVIAHANDAVLTEYMLTTSDNPFNPFLQYDDWYAFDVKEGYNTCSYLARIVKSSDELSEADQALAIDSAMNEIVELNLSGRHIKVSRDSFKKRMSTIRNINLLK